MSRLLIVLLVGSLSLVSAYAQAIPPGLPSDHEIRELLADRIAARQDVGIAVGLIGPEGRRIIAHGSFASDDPRPVTGDTLFEIGSVTKVFTTLLLADMAQRGEVALDDPLARYLPADVKVPESGRAITLQDLATHTSGLPRMPSNFAPRDPANPYADYSVRQLYEFLSTHALTRDVGAQYEYSNLGMGLLGHVLARRADTDYEKLVVSRIAGPLRLASTRMTLGPEMQARLAAGHDRRLNRVPNWDDTTLAGAGSLYSSVDDLLTFLSAHVHADESPLTSAIDATLAVRKATGAENLRIGLGWHVTTRTGRDFVWHNGGTGGYASFIGFSPRTGMGLVVLSNSTVGVDDLALHLIDGLAR